MAMDAEAMINELTSSVLAGDFDSWNMNTEKLLNSSRQDIADVLSGLLIEIAHAADDCIAEDFYECDPEEARQLGLRAVESLGPELIAVAQSKSIDLQAEAGNYMAHLARRENPLGDGELGFQMAVLLQTILLIGLRAMAIDGRTD